MRAFRESILKVRLMASTRGWTEAPSGHGYDFSCFPPPVDIDELNLWVTLSCDSFCSNGFTEESPSYSIRNFHNFGPKSSKTPQWGPKVFGLLSCSRSLQPNIKYFHWYTSSEAQAMVNLKEVIHYSPQFWCVDSRCSIKTLRTVIEMASFELSYTQKGRCRFWRQ